MRKGEIVLCDTTLRDGEQAPGVSFGVEEKVFIATLLCETGIREIEAGTAAMGGEEFKALKALAGLGLEARLTGWCRTLSEDVDATVEAGLQSAAIALPSSKLHLREKLGWSLKEAEENLQGAICRAKGRGLYVIAALEDASRAEPEALVRFARAAREAGADRLRLSDTLGLLDPLGAFRLVRKIRQAAGLALEFHGHNDFGLATANALAAAKAGAGHLSVTVLGLGERAGNAPLEEVALALLQLSGLDPKIRTKLLPRLFKAVERASGRPIPPGKPIAGSAAFTHESGIHVDGLLKNPQTYQPFPPALVGRRHEIVGGKHSGGAALKYLAGMKGGSDG